MIGGAWRARSPRPWFERFGELVVASGLIILSLPLMIVVAIAIKCDTRGPVLLLEQRTSPSGDRFRAYRFRITVDGQSVRFSAKPLTFVGDLIHWLRLDALPQLVNVLRGEMTCIPGDPERLFFLD